MQQLDNMTKQVQQEDWEDIFDKAVLDKKGHLVMSIEKTVELKHLFKSTYEQGRKEEKERTKKAAEKSFYEPFLSDVLKVLN